MRLRDRLVSIALLGPVVVACVEVATVVTALGVLVSLAHWARRSAPNPIAWR